MSNWQFDKLDNYSLVEKNNGVLKKRKYVPMYYNIIIIL